MPNILSTHASPELYNRVETLGQIEGQSNSQMVLAAVEFWTQLPPEAHRAIRQIQEMGEHVARRLVRQVTRETLDLQFEAANAGVAASVRLPGDLAPLVGPDADDQTFLDSADAAIAQAARATYAT